MHQLRLATVVALAFSASTSINAYAGTPYSGTPVTLPGVIEAENFDKGGEGVGYHDLSKGNSGGQYRTSEDVDIVASTDSAGGGFVVNYFQTGEWLAYTVSVPVAGLYDIAIRASNNYNSGAPAFHIEVDGANVSGSIPVPKTGSWDAFQWVEKQAISLSAGTHVLKIVSDAQYFNVNSIRVNGPAATSAYSGQPFSGTPIALPLAFPAVNFDKGGQGVAYNDLSSGNLGGQYRTSEDVDIYTSTDITGGPYQVANFQTGEWMAYTVNVPSSGKYDVAVRAANNFNAGTQAFHIEVDGVNATGSVVVPKTGAWDTYQWVGKQGIDLAAGKRVLKLVSDGQWFNVSSISVLPSAIPPPASTPYSGTPIALPLVFPAANFDKGGEGIAYHDLTTGNSGGQYRTSEDVDIITSSDANGGGYAVNNFQTGEWVAYTVNVLANGSYDVGIWAANNFNNAQPAFHIEVDGNNATGTVSVAKTGGWDAYQWFGKQGVNLSAGRHVLKLVSEAQYFNVSGISVLSTVPSPTTGGAGAGTPPASLLFWSGFDGALSFVPQTDCWVNGCFQDFVGTDSTTGFSWPPRIASGDGKFQQIVNGPAASPSIVGNYMYNEIQTVTGRTGGPTRALFSQILQSGCCGTNGQGDGSTQEPYIIFPASDVGELYMSFWVKLQSDLVQKLDAADPWRALFEVKTTDTDWRLVIGITDWGKVGQAMWDLSTDTYVPTYQRFWRLLNVPSVPVDRWFKLEVYWKRSSGSDGRVWMAADGKVLADQFGANFGPNRSPIDRIFWNLYTGGTYPIYQWIDDVQIWSSFPTAKPGDPWYDGVYAPH